MSTTSRNYSIDLLRIVSMIGVVFLHVLGHGGVLNLVLSPLNYSMVWFLEVLAFPAVNCFVLISGYVGYKSERVFPKIKNLLTLLFTVSFYSILLFFIFYFCGPEEVGLKDMIRSFFPMIFKNYWFFTIYFGLMLLSPMLNLFVYKSNFKHTFAFFTVFLFFIIISTVYDSFSFIDGYTVIWFVFMYLVGAMINKYNLNRLLSRKIWFLIFVAMFVITWLSKIILNFLNISFLASHSSILVNYVSPTIVLMAIALLMFFSRIECKPSFASIISFFSSSAFSVYLIHDNTYVRNYVISRIHTYIDDSNFVLFILFIVSIVVAIFLICILIDKVRIIIFKTIKVDKMSEKIGEIIEKLINIIYMKFEKKVQKTEV